MAKANSVPTRVASRLSLFPDSTRLQGESICIAGASISDLVEEFGTPLYIYDRITLDNSAAAYKKAFAQYDGPSIGITYAGKAFLCTAIAEWVESQRLWLDCTGETEIRVAVGAGVARQRILVHGVNKSPADLEAAMKQAGTIVVDNLPELNRLRKMWKGIEREGQVMPQLWLRLLPGLAVLTHHAHTQTGQHDSKFGMTPEEMEQAAQLCSENGLPLRGIHFHQGSNFRDPAPLVAAIGIGLDQAAKLNLGSEWNFSPGGGWGVAYHEDELPQPDIEKYAGIISEEVLQGCRKRGLALPHLHIEPGRSLIARAGVAVYRVGAVKKRGDRTWLLVDGGMTDNPRHAMYGSWYTALPVEKPIRPMQEVVAIAGPFCESGDILIEGLSMPKIEEGELIAIPVSGAYQLSMSSNYNGARRPAVLWLEKDSQQLIQRREDVEDLTGRDISLQV